MHFLCLHGKGTNSKVFEIQTAALRYALGDHHTYDFAEGVISAPINPEARDYFPADDAYFQYFSEDDPAGCLKAVHDLDNFIAAEGPFDGVIAFSQGAAVASTLMLDRLRRDRARELVDPVFKCAIFIGAAIPCDPAELAEQGIIRPLSSEADGEVIEIPTTHIWGQQEWSPLPPRMAMLCRGEQRNVYTHEGGHVIPGTQMGDALTECVRVMKRAISMAQYRQY
ncbi:MAG: hypothetical protein Q9160_007154 [Pyrenula sp. 1 TL-2023]